MPLFQNDGGVAGVFVALAAALAWAWRIMRRTTRDVIDDSTYMEGRFRKRLGQQDERIAATEAKADAAIERARECEEREVILHRKIAELQSKLPPGKDPP